MAQRSAAWWLVLAALGLVTVAGTAVAGFDPGSGVITSERWRSGVPLGGIGAGAVEVLTDGALGNATLNHSWDRPTGVLKGGFLAVRAKGSGEASGCLLRLADKGEYGNVSNAAGTRMRGLYPRAEVEYDTPGLPVQVKLQAWSPLIPRNVKDSALPVAVFEVTLRNPGAAPVEASAAISWENLLGFGGRREHAEWDERAGCRQREAEVALGGTVLRGMKYLWDGPGFHDLRQNALGDYFLGAEQAEGVDTSVCPGYGSGGDTLPWWGQFVRSGELPGVQTRGLVGEELSLGRPAAAVAASCDLGAGESRTLRFVLAWNLPTLRMRHSVTRETGRMIERADAGREALDGDPATRWSTGRPMKPGDELTVDLGEARSVCGLVLDSAKSPTDYPHGYRIEAEGADGAWVKLAEATEEQATAAQEQGVLRVGFAALTTRRLRITNLEMNPGWFWSVHELTVLGPQGPLDLAQAKVGDRLAEVTTRYETTDGGSYHSRFFGSAGEVAAYVLHNRERLAAGTQAWQDLVLDSSLPFWLKLKLINCAFSMTSATVLLRDGRFSVLESPIDMGGALGTMDQRMAAHAFYTQMFPELDKVELGIFGDCQQNDGRITHFVGNVHEVLGDANVGYGVTDWPDLTASWVMQVFKLYRWTGDRAFLEAQYPRVQKAARWFKAADRDGDGIPEGGSTYDYETLPRGAFVYSANCALGALLAAGASAQALGDEAGAAEFGGQFEALRKATITRLWNGQFFRKWRHATTTRENPNSFVAALAGDWLAHLSGLPDTLPRPIINQEMEQLIARHQNAFFPVPPMEVTPDGRAATSACYVLQHEPYLGCEAIYRGFTDDGLETLRRVYLCAWEKNKSPWDQSLAYDAPSGGQGGLRSYMTCPTSWHVLSALSGASLDVPGQTLYLSPRLPGGESELRIPLFLGSFRAWLDYQPQAKVLRLKVLETYGDTPVELRWVAADGNGVKRALKQPFAVTAGAELDLWGYVGQLAPVDKPRQVRFTPPKAEAAVPGLPRRGWVLSDNVPGRPLNTESDLGYAVDGSTGTRWTTSRAMQPGDWLQVDLGKAALIQGVRASVEGSPRDYPYGFEVLVSADGEAWSKVAQGDQGQSRRLIRHGVWRVSFAPLAARFVRIVQTGSSGFWWWSVKELYVMPEGWRDPLPPLPVRPDRS